MKKLKELLDELNQTDETHTIEAKKGTAVGRSILETICAFANEPGLGGGYILLGVERVELSLFPEYEVTGVTNPDKIQLDLATQCATSFNIPIRPSISIETSGDKNVIKIWMEEIAPSQKPVYFQRTGLPSGAYRRIGSSDQACVDDDLMLFYNHNESFDGTVVSGSSWSDIDESAIEQYRLLRSRVNENAEELTYSDEDLLYALNCIKKEKNGIVLTLAGLQVFGSKMAQRRLCPALRVDYIRVPGNEWVEDPDNRFTTIDMRGALLFTISRAYSAVVDDLPKGFLLPEGQLQAEAVGLPSRVLREALVNALMHRSYKVNQPIQIIRYGNRIEIKNPGYSLKSEEALGEPGSNIRNQFIAAIFHETNLAETKGSGIRTMRNLMEKAGMIPPTFESHHSQNEFTSRLLLHHLLSEEDIAWLSNFNSYNLNEDQKKALVFVREVGAIDNASYRQICGADILKASAELRALKTADLLEAKGKSKATYYVSGSQLLSALPREVFNHSENQIDTSLSAPPPPLSAPPLSLSAPPTQWDDMPSELKTLINALGQRNPDKSKLKQVILKICQWKELSAADIAKIIDKSEKYVLREFVTPMREEGILEYTIPDMANHPNQAYRAK